MDRKGENSFARKLLNTKLRSDGQTSPPLLQFVLDPDFLQAVPFPHISYTKVKQNKYSICKWRKEHWKHATGLHNGNLGPSSLSPGGTCGEKSKWDSTKTKTAFSWPTTTCQKGNRRTQFTHSVSWSLCWIICFLLLNASSILCLLDLTHRLVRNLKPNKKCQ